MVFRFFVKDVNMPEELLLLAIVGALTLYISLSLLVIRLIWMVSTGLGTTAELMAVLWLIGLLLIFAMPLKDAGTSDTSNVQGQGRGAALSRSVPCTTGFGPIFMCYGNAVIHTFEAPHPSAIANLRP